MKNRIIKVLSAVAALLLVLSVAAACAEKEKESNSEKMLMALEPLDEVVEKIEEKGAIAAVIHVYEEDVADGTVYLDTLYSNMEKGAVVTVAVNDLSIKDKVYKQNYAVKHFSIETFEKILDDSSDPDLIKAYYSEIDGYMYMTPDVTAKEVEKLSEAIEKSGFTKSDIMKEGLATGLIPTLESDILAEVLDENNCEYTISDEGVVITDILAESGNIVVPDEMDSKPVVAVAVEGKVYNVSDRLYSVTIGKNVKSITSFGQNCVSLMSVNCGDNPMIVSSGAVAGSRYCVEDEEGFTTLDNTLVKYNGTMSDVTIPESIRYIADGAFADNVIIKSVTLHRNVMGISSKAFSGCQTLEICDLSDTKALLGDAVFKNCVSLKEMTVPAGNKSIGSELFFNCTSLEKISFSGDVASIATGAFDLCEALRGVYIDDIDAFCGIEFGYLTANPLIYAHDLYLGGELVTEITVPDSITSISNYAFAGSSIESITIPDSVTNIGRSAFAGCMSLTAVNGAGTVTYCGENCFEETPWLTSMASSDSDGLVIMGDGVLLCYSKNDSQVVIPDSVKYICPSAFEFGIYDRVNTVIIGAGVTAIDKLSFGNGFVSLKKVVIPETVETITYICVPAYSDGDPCIEGATIYCAPGSAAEEYARMYSIPYEYIG
ncbi:MAG: leucine-rich repeat protein [Clostridia bacterium]|nr:leucine-rich repeat protein [Clostridia bacterium]